MGLRVGYKQTEVGVIPEDWEVRQIQSVCKLINGRGFKPFEWKFTGLPIIRIQNLNGSDDFNFFQGHFDPKLEVKAGQLLFAWSGSRGTSFGPHIWSGPTGLLNYHTWKILVNEAEIVPNFFYFALRKLTEFIEGRAHGASALVHTQKWEMEGFQFPLPPTKAEQTAIAKALSDVDALLAGLGRLIAKKRALKQAALHQLLTAQTRLPGFSGDWQVKRLGECLTERPAYGINAASVPFSDRLPRYLRITDISDDGKFTPNPLVSVNTEASEYYLSSGDLVFARTGASVGKSYLYDQKDGELIFAGFLIKIRPNPKILKPHYLFELTKTRAYWNWVSVMSMRSGQPGINGLEYEQFQFHLPPTIEEQTAIAAVLSDMDAEIAALERRLAKTRDLKQAMMQELLTGRIRLL